MSTRLQLRIALLWVLTLPAMALSAQSDDAIEVYPVRVGHRVGFVKFYPGVDTTYVDTIIAPRYDYIGDEYLPWNTIDKAGGTSPFRLFERDERVGLLDPYLRERLPADYRRIRPLTDSLFALERDSLFTLSDASGRNYLDGARYDDICPAPLTDEQQACFFVQQGVYWGVQRQDGKMLVDPQFLRILPAGATGYFKVIPARDAHRGWRVINRHGRYNDPGPAEEVIVLNANTIAQRTKGKWAVWRRISGKWKQTESAVISLARLDDRLAVMHRVNGNNIVLWDHESGQEVATTAARPRSRENTPPDRFVFDERPHLYFPWYYPLDGAYHIICEDGGGAGYIERLVDNTGRTASGPFAAILPTAIDGLYKVNRLGYWGLLAPRAGGLIHDCTLQEIGAFENGIAITRIGEAYGAVAFREGRFDTLAVVHDRIEQTEGRLLAKLADQVVAFELSPQGEFTESAIFSNLSLVARNTNQITEAIAQAKTAAPSYSPRKPGFGQLQLKQQAGEWWAVKRMERVAQPDTLIWQVKMPAGKRPGSVTESLEDSMLYFHDDPVTVTDENLQVALTSRIRRIRFYEHATGRVPEHPAIIGMRPFDENYPYTAFLTPAGEMGLIDRSGQQLIRNGAPLRFTYIGTFECGRARVCIDGAWAYAPGETAPPQPYKFRLRSLLPFRSSLQCMPAKASSAPNDGALFLVDAPGKQRRWGYIDETGTLVLETDAGYVEDFHHQDSTAFVVYENGEPDAYGHPDANYGLIGYDGQSILPPVYDRISRLQDFYLLTMGGTPTFFFTQQGHEIFVNPTRVRPFSEGMAQFRDTSGLWGYVSQEGKVTIPPQYTLTRPFSDGLALVARADGACLFVGRDGKVAFETGFQKNQWRGIGDFHDGLAWFKGTGWAWGAFNRRGEVVVRPSAHYSLVGRALPAPDEAYPLPLDARYGLSCVQIKAGEGKAYAQIVDSSGQVVFEDRALFYIGPFNAQGIAVYQEEEQGMYGLINSRGTRICPPRYREIGPFREGYAAAKGEDGKWGFIRQDGEAAIPLAFARVDVLSEGLAAVKKEQRGGWMYVDATGRVKIPGPFDEALPFSGGVSYVRNDGRPRAINRAGQEILMEGGKPVFFAEGIFGVQRSTEKAYYADASGNNLFSRTFAEISPFQLGIAKVRPLSEEGQRRRPLGAINRRGVMVVPPKYRMLHIQPDGNIIINPQRFFGLADKAGKMVLPPDFDRIDQLAEEGLFKVERGEKIGYYHFDGSQMKVYWPLQY